MADVVLNLKYNDGGATASINNLISELQRIENKQWKINISDVGQSFASQLESAAKKFESVTTEINKSFGRGHRGLDAGFSDLEKVLERINGKIETTRLRMLEILTSPKRGQKVATFDLLSKQLSELEKQAENVNTAIKKINSDPASQEFQKLASEFSLINKQTEAISENLALSIGKTFGQTPTYVDEWAEINDIAKKEIADNLELEKQATEEFAKQQEERKRIAEQEERERKELQEASAKERLQRERESNIAITQGQHQMWRGIQQTASATINIITSGWNTFKSVIEAPLNLTGVSSLVSMLESMEGSLLLNQISSNITRGFSESVTRFDILRTFPEVMESIGFSSLDASDSMDRLYKSVLGLPTAFEDIVQSTQYFALVLDDLDKATSLSIAANNAFVASGATSQQITTGMRQLQYLIDGTKLRSTQWYSLIRSMPVALREVGRALGYPDFNSFTADLMSGTIATETLIDSLIDVGLNSTKIAGVIDTMKSRVQASLDNVANAARRMGTSMLDALDNTLQRTGGKGIAENIRGVSSILDHIAEVASGWINEHGTQIQALIDKFFAIDWTSVIPSFFDGLIDFANNALDNIGKYISEIGDIITRGRQFFNDIENSRIVALLSGGSSVISGFTQAVAGISNIIAGRKLINIGRDALSALGVSSASSGGLISSLFGGVSFSSFIGVLGAIAADVLAIRGLVSLTTPHDIKAQAEYTTFQQQPEIVDYASSAKKNYYKYLGAAIEAKRSGNDELAWEYIDRANNEADTVSRYSLSDFVPKLMRDDLGYLIDVYGDYREPFVKEIDKNAESEVEKISKRIENRGELIKQITDIYETQISEIEEKITELQTKRQELLDKINSKPDVLGRDFFKTLGLLSEGYEDAEGKDYLEEAKDAKKFYEENLPTFQDWATGMQEYIDSLGEGETKSIAQEYFTALLSGFDVTNADQLKYILDTLGSKTPEQVVEDFLTQQAAAVAKKDWENAINQILADQLGVTIEEYEQQKESLEKEESSAIGFILTGIEKDFEILQEEYPEVISYIEDQSKELANTMNEAFSTLDSSLALIELDGYFDDIKKKILQERYEIQRLMQISPDLPSTQPRSRGGETAPLATGGYLFAPIGTDTVPAMLTPGEYVQRRAAVEHFGRMFMDRINNLDLNGALRALHISVPYATGGVVKNDSRSYRDNHAVVNQVFNGANASTGFRRASRYVRALG